MKRAFATLAVTLVLAGSAGALTAPCGAEFQVNTYTTSTQGGARVAALADGGFILVWTSYGSAETDTDQTSVQSRRFDALGQPLGPEFQVNTYTSGFQSAVGLAAAPDGGFIVTWRSTGSSESDTDADSVQARRFDAAGAALGPEFQVNTYTTGPQVGGHVGVDAAGGFVVTWSSLGSFETDTASSSIQARRFDALGQPLGPEFQVNSYTTNDQYGATIAVEPNGAFVIAWMGYGSPESDTASSSVHARRFDAPGQPAGDEFQVNDVTAGYQSYAQIGRDEQGGFVVVWSGNGVRAKRYDAAGLALGPEFLASQVGTFQRGVDVAADGQAGFVVVWELNGEPGDNFWTIKARRFLADGSAEGPEFRVNSYTNEAQYFPTIGFDGGENFLVAWLNTVGGVGNDPDGTVEARRLAIDTCVLPTTTSTTTSTTTTVPTDLLGAQKLLLREQAARGRPLARLESTDAAVGTGRGAGSSDDPTVHGGRMRIVSLAGAFDLDVELPGSGWRRTRAGYRYHGGDGAAVRLKTGRALRVTLRPEAFGLGATDPTPIVGVLRLGERRLCVEFPSGSVVLKPTKLRAGRTTPPDACREPPPEPSEGSGLGRAR